MARWYNSKILRDGQSLLLLSQILLRANTEDPKQSTNLREGNKTNGKSVQCPAMTMTSFEKLKFNNMTKIIMINEKKTRNKEKNENVQRKICE